IEMVLISSLADEETDDATAKIRATWRGRIRIVRVATAAVQATSGALDVRAQTNDAVAAGLSLLPMSVLSSPVRVARERTTSEDSAWARVSGHVLVHWPAN